MGKRVRRIPDFRWFFVVIIIVALLIILATNNNNQGSINTSTLTDSLDIDNGDLKINWDNYPTTDIELNGPLKIDKSGVYHLTGTLNKESIKIDSAKAEIKLILDNVYLLNSNGPTIECLEAEDLVIELKGNNYITDNTKYSSESDEDISGAIYSKADLTFQGDGTLHLNSNYDDAIVGKDDVKFRSGNYIITAEDDAIRGKDSVYVVDGKFDINSVAHCVKTTNDTDPGKGFILIEKGDFKLSSIKGKGFRAVKTIQLQNGNILMDTFDDAIHANNELIIDGGKINIGKAYEGLEAQVVTINNGDIDIIANDDGINAGGGADESSMNRPGANPFKADEDCAININGGKLYINSAGDGIDSNGWLYINGGMIIVDGPTNNDNGALDAGMSIIMRGGEAIAIGSSGMAESLGKTSSIFNVSIFLPSLQPENTSIIITNKNDETIIEHISAKQFSNITFGSNQLTLGETYKLYLNDQYIEEFTISDVVTTIGETNNSFEK